MPLKHSAPTPVARRAPRRLRPAGPSCRGGVSSVLRLTQPVARRMPTALDLTDWMTRAASVPMPVTGPLTDFYSRASASEV